MTETPLVVDYSRTIPGGAAIKAAGYTGVVRYLSPDPTKNLTKAERDDLLSHGLTIRLVWESYASRASEGFTAGVQDAKAANAQAAALGCPGDQPIYYVLQDSGTVNIPGVLEYTRGAAYVNSRGVGAYGGIDVINAAAASGWALWFWQTEGWSGTNISPHAHLYQRVTPTVPHPLAGTDENVVIKDCPAWSANSAPVPPPAPPKPAPVPAQNGKLTVQNIDLSHVTNDPKTWVHGPGVAPMQRLLGVVPVDGVGGPHTQGALAAAQIRIFHVSDKVFGPNTADGLLAGR